MSPSSVFFRSHFSFFSDDFCIKFLFYMYKKRQINMKKKNNNSVHFDKIIIIVSCFYILSFSRAFFARVCIQSSFAYRNLRYSLSALLILVSVALGLLSRHVCIKAPIVSFFILFHSIHSPSSPFCFGFVYILLSHIFRLLGDLFFLCFRFCWKTK